MKAFISCLVKMLLLSHVQLFLIPWTARLFCLWNSPGKNTGVGSHSHLQRIFPNQGLNLGLLHGRKIFEPVNLGTKESYNAYVVLSVNKIPINVRYNNTSLQS